MQNSENLYGKENTIEWSRRRKDLDRHFEAYLEDMFMEAVEDYCGTHLIMMTIAEDIKDYLDEETFWQEQLRVTAE